MKFMNSERILADSFASEEAFFFDLYQKECELNEALADFKEALSSFEIYDAICNCIKEEGGVSKSLEILFGENFSSSVSMEEEATAEKQSWAKKLWEKIEILIAKFIAWIRGSNRNLEKMMKELSIIDELVQKDQIEYPFEVPIFKSQMKWATLVDSWSKVLENAIDLVNSEINTEVPEDDPKVVELEKSIIELQNRYENIGAVSDAMFDTVSVTDAGKFKELVKQLGDILTKVHLTELKVIKWENATGNEIDRKGVIKTSDSKTNQRTAISVAKLFSIAKSIVAGTCRQAYLLCSTYKKHIKKSASTSEK